jgi:hypothetical protein
MFVALYPGDMRRQATSKVTKIPPKKTVDTPLEET